MSDSYKDELREIYLAKTAQGFNDHVILVYLKSAVGDYLVKRDEKEAIDRPIYKNEIVDKICEYIYLYTPKNFFWEICLDKIFSDMEKYEFDKQPSINKNQAHTSYFFSNDEITEKINCCEKINLARHTLNLIETYINNFRNHRTFSSLPAFNILMGCLLHDFGKSIKLAKDDFGISNERDMFRIKHEIISGNYIVNLITRIKKDFFMYKEDINDEFKAGEDQLLVIKRAVLEHHEKVFKEGSLTDAIKSIDADARMREWAAYKKEQFEEGQK